MPRYYFDIDDGSTIIPDEFGTDLPDDYSASKEGARALAEITNDLIRRDPQPSMTLWIRNESGQLVRQVTLSFAVRTVPVRVASSS
jgi:hypothetical protein